MKYQPDQSDERSGGGMRAAIMRQVERLRGSGLAAIGRNTGWLMLEKLSRAALSVTISAWVARYLGPAQFSSIAYGLAVAVFLMPLAQLGFYGIVVRDFAREPDRTAEIFGTAVLLRVVSGFTCFVIAVAAMLLTVDDFESRLVGILIAGQLLFQTNEVIDFWLQSRLESRIGVKSRLAATFSVSALKVALILAGAPLWTFALCISLEVAVISLALTTAYRRHSTMGPLKFDGSRAKQLVKDGGPFLFAALAVALCMRIDQILLRHLTSPMTLGLYAAVVQFSQAGQILPQSLLASMTPSLARAAKAGQDQFDRVSRTMFLTMGGIGLCTAIGILIVAPFVIPLFLGSAYVGAVPILQIYGFTNIFLALGNAWIAWASAAGRGTLVPINMAVGTLVSFAANMLLIPVWGMVGAAIAANLAYASSGLLMNVFTSRRALLLQLGIRKIRADLR